MVGRLASSCVIMILLVMATYLALGPPNLGGAVGFLSGSVNSLSDTVAVLQVFAWLIISLGVVVIVYLSARSAPSAAALYRQRWSRAVLLLAVGVVLLGVGVNHHLNPGYQPCCGSVAQSQGGVR